MVVLLICLVLVVIAIGVVIRLLVVELARSAAPRAAQGYQSRLAHHRTVERAVPKAPVSAVRAADRPAALRPVTDHRAPDDTFTPDDKAAPNDWGDDGRELVHDGDLLVEVTPRPRTREVRRITKVAWWRRLRSGTALVMLVALLGVATAAVIGAIVLFFAFVLEQAIG